MVSPNLGNPNFDQINPNFSIRVNDNMLSHDLVGLIRSIEYESTDNMADMAKIVFANPGFVISNVKGLQPGNEIFIEFGYGRELSPIGRVEIVRHHANYPRAGMPTLEIIGYTADRRMMDNNSSSASQKERVASVKAERKSFNEAVAEAKKQDAEFNKKNQAANPGAAAIKTVIDPQQLHNRVSSIYKEIPYSAAIWEKCVGTYKFLPQIDDTKGVARDFFQPVKMSDYEFVRALANITGYFFWVDGDIDGNWTLHFKEPGSESYLQETRYNFTYNLTSGDSTLLDFRPEMLTHGQKTKIQAQYFDKKTGRLVSVEFPKEAEKESPDVIGAAYPDGAERSVENETFTEDHTSGVAIKLYINDFAFEARAPRRVRDKAHLEAWAKQWYEEHKQNFVMAEGSVIGLETLFARQIHELSGLNGGLDGLYYFSRVRHRLDSTGYECDFSARKVVD